MATKEQEIKALEGLRKVTEDGESYTSEFLSTDRINHMIENIKNDFPITMNLGLVNENEVEKRIKGYTSAIDSLTLKVQFLQDSIKTELSSFLNTLIKEKQFDIASKHFSEIEIMKAKLIHCPNELTDTEKEAFLNSIQ